MAATIITAYLAEGLAAARPASPAITTGSISFYYATDTAALTMWDANGSAWVTVGGGGGGGGNSWCSPSATANWGFDTTAHATKGNTFIPAINITIDSVVFISDGGNSGHTLNCQVWSFNTGTNALIAQQGSTATATGPGSAGPVQFTFASKITLTAGTAYIVLITDTGGTSTTSIDMPVNASTTRPTYTGFPSRIDNNPINGSGGAYFLNSTGPAATNVMTQSSSGVYGIQIRVQV